MLVIVDDMYTGPLVHVEHGVGDLVTAYELEVGTGELLYCKYRSGT